MHRFYKHKNVNIPLLKQKSIQSTKSPPTDLTSRCEGRLTSVEGKRPEFFYEVT